MKGLYAALAIVSLVIISMLALSFFFIDRQRHQTFLYAIYRDDTLVGYEKVDRYVLENSVIYKSVIEQPRDMLHRKIISKTTFDIRGKNFTDYRKEIAGNGAKRAIYIGDKGDSISFLAAGNGTFSFLEEVPTYGNSLPFEKMSAAAYPAVARRYNFKRRGRQFVNVLTPISDSLPPVRDVLSVTWIGKDTIEIEGRKITCERLVLELRSGDLMSMWITRTFHNLLMVKIPKYGYRAVFCTARAPIPVVKYSKTSERYTEKAVAFGTTEISLRGTLSIPLFGTPPYPAVLLIWDRGPLDRDALGLFVDIAHSLADKGYCVFRFDKRGIGQSQGFFSTYTQTEEISDLKKAITVLKSHPQVDKSRIAVIGHSEGGFYATSLAAGEEDIRACVILSALSSLNPLKNGSVKLADSVKRMVPEDEGYLESALSAAKMNREMIRGKGDWITIMDKRVFTKKMALENSYDPLETIKKVKVPVLILHGRKDSLNSVREAKELSEALAGAGNDNVTTVYFGSLDHFFGIMVTKAPVRDHLEVEGEVLSTISSWLDKNLVPPLPAAVAPEPERSMAVQKSIGAAGGE